MMGRNFLNTIYFRLVYPYLGFTFRKAIKKYTTTRSPGRLLPQPNSKMWATQIVMKLMGLK